MKQLILFQCNRIQSGDNNILISLRYIYQLNEFNGAYRFLRQPILVFFMTTPGFSQTLRATIF